MVDSKVSEVRPAAKGPESFQGVYRNGARYRSSSSAGLHAQQYLQEWE